MADHTAIEWTDATWNIVTGCSVVSPGCTNCYAMKWAGGRLRNHPSRAGLTKPSKAGPVWTGEVRFNEAWLDQPLRWKRPRMIFVCAHGDLFHEDVPDAWIDRVFAVMALSPRHIFQVLTKRPARMREYLSDDHTGPMSELPEARVGCEVMGIARALGEDVDQPWWDAWWDWPLPNVWLSTSVEDQTRADERIPHLLATPAAVRFVSAEPLLGAVDLTPWLDDLRTLDSGYKAQVAKGMFNEYQVDALKSPVLDWIIVGGESGPGARPMHPDWARSIRDQCAAAGVPFFFKQWGAWAPVEHIGAPFLGGLDQTARNPDPRYLSMRYDRFDDHGRPTNDPDYDPTTAWRFERVGKKAAGAVLDGREYRGMPA